MKDKTNLLNHDQFLSKDYSDIGEQSIKITKKQTQSSYSRLVYLDNIINKTFTVSATIKSNKNYTTQLILGESYSTGQVISIKTVNIPSNTASNVSVTLTTSSICEVLFIQINSNDSPANTFYYIDNINLSLIQ